MLCRPQTFASDAISLVAVAAVFFTISSCAEVCVSAVPVKSADEVAVHFIEVAHTYLSIKTRPYEYEGSRKCSKLG